MPEGYYTLVKMYTSACSGITHTLRFSLTVCGKKFKGFDRLLRLRRGKSVNFQMGGHKMVQWSAHPLRQWMGIQVPVLQCQCITVVKYTFVTVFWRNGWSSEVPVLVCKMFLLFVMKCLCISPPEMLNFLLRKPREKPTEIFSWFPAVLAGRGRLMGHGD